MLTLGLVSLVLTADGGGPDSAGVARALGAELGAKKFSAAHARFEPGIAKRLPEAELGRQWKQLADGLGAFKEVRLLREEASAKGHVVFLDCVHEHGSLPLRVALDEQQRVIGLRPVPSESPVAFEAAAREVVAELAAGSFSKVFGRFAPRMASALPEAELAKVWAGVTAQAGAFRQVEAAKVEPRPPFVVVELRSAFAKDTLTINVVLDSTLKVAGLFFAPTWKPPAYAEPASFEERPLVVGTAAYPLHGTLTLPKGKGPCPVVVLVHGSGPNDADESVGPNRLFKDLAWGLASRKVAVFRYPKRTFEYRGKLSNADIKTVKEETIDDALSAVAKLATVKEIDAKRIFLAGHSMGASLAPRMGAAAPKVRGIVMLAASSRKQWHLVVEQLRYLKAGDAAVRQAEANAKKLDDPALEPDDVVDGISGAYWLDMRSDDELGTAAKLGKPILVLQGERDYQVTMTDFSGWKKALHGKRNVTLKSYPALNHLFMPGTGKSTPAEYDEPSHVPLEVVADLAEWVGAH